MVKSPVKVIIRTRPTEEFASNNININNKTGEINIFVPKNESGGLINNQNDTYKFKFDHILHNCTQESVFESSQEYLGMMFDGLNVSVMTYGQTGSGKTYTMMGGMLNYKYRGIVPRSVSMLFSEVNKRSELSVVVNCSYIEIYNEIIFDLLNPLATELTIQDDAQKGVTLKNLLYKEVASEEECLNCLFEGEANRTVGAHSLNERSSRSHTVFSVYLAVKSKIESNQKILHSKLHLIDLAGSERTKKTGSDGIVLKEASYINKSLSFLEQVVNALAEKRDYVSYRQSKLTNFLRDSLGGNSKTVMFANIWPSAYFIEETCSTLRFASRMAKITNEVTVNVTQDTTAYIKALEKEIKEIKRELAMHDTLISRNHINYEPYTKEQQASLKQQALAYIDSEGDKLEFESVRQAHEYFYVFKDIFKNFVMGRPEKDGSVRYDPGMETHPDVETKPVDHNVHDERVGDVDMEGGFGLGKADPSGKPKETFYNSPLKSSDKAKANESSYGKPFKKDAENITKTNFKTKLDRNQAFIEFKETAGLDFVTALEQDKAQLKESKAQLKVSHTALANLKKEIDTLATTVKQLKDNLGETNSEYKAQAQQLYEMKGQYKNGYSELKELKDTVTRLNRTNEENMEKLLADFETWYTETYEALEKQVEGIEEEVYVSLDEDKDAFFSAKQKADKLHKKTATFNKRKN